MKIKNIILGFGIFIVYILAMLQGLDAFFPEPYYENYCDVSFNGRSILLSGCKLSNDLRIKENSCMAQGADFVYEYGEDACPNGGYCNECSMNYSDALDSYAGKLFLVALILGVVVLFAGVFYLSKEPVGSSLIASAIFTVFYGVVRNWRNFGTSWRFLLLFVLLIILIWISLGLDNFGKRKGWNFKFWKRH